MAVVTIKVRHDIIRNILAKTRSELREWAEDVLHSQVEPVTPIDTGALRENTAVEVKQSDVSTEVWWWWKQPYAEYVEDMTELGKSPRTPGTIAPFAVPTITKAVNEEGIKMSIRRAFGG